MSYNYHGGKNFYIYGGKSGYGTYQTIINQIPPHEVYIEPFLGGGGIMRRKRPAKRNIGIDLDPCVIETWQDYKGVEIYQADALIFLKEFKFTGKEFVYADPPYLLETRSGKFRYPFEMSQEDHVRLLCLLKELPCPVMLSGYLSDLYKKELACFRNIQFQSMTRGGKSRTEFLWMNYADPTSLHDYQYLGSNFRERDKISRRKKRFFSRLKQMPKLERQSILAAIQEFNFEEF
jgi:site-specific DNA-adenine methylase